MGDKYSVDDILAEFNKKKDEPYAKPTAEEIARGFKLPAPSSFPDASLPESDKNDRVTRTVDEIINNFNAGKEKASRNDVSEIKPGSPQDEPPLSIKNDEEIRSGIAELIDGVDIIKDIRGRAGIKTGISGKTSDFYNKKKLETFFESYYENTEEDILKNARAKTEAKLLAEQEELQEEMLKSRREDTALFGGIEEPVINTVLPPEPAVSPEPSIMPTFSGRFGRILNEAEANEVPLGDLDKGLDEIEDFFNPDDAKAVELELRSQRRQGAFKLFLIAAFSLALLYIDLVDELGLNLPSLYSESDNFMFGLVNTLLLFLIIVFSAGTFFGGLKGIFTFKPKNSSIPALALCAGLLQAVLYMFRSSMAGGVMFCGVAALCYFFAVVGKYLQIAAAQSNFELISTRGEKHCLIKINNEDLPSSKDIYAGTQGCAAVRTGFAGGFLEKAYSEDLSEKWGRPVSFISVLGIIAIFIGAFIKNDFNSALVNFAAASCIGASFTSALCFTFPFLIECIRARGAGAVIAGPCAAEAYAKTEIIAFKDTDILSPEKSVLTGIKPFDHKNISTTILKAASLAALLKGPMAGAFLKSLDNRGELLLDVKDFSCYEGLGASGSIDGERCFIGNEQFMRQNDIILPMFNYSELIKNNSSGLIFFAGGKKLIVVFAVSYEVPEATKKAFSRLDNSQTTLLLLTNEFTISKELAVNGLNAKNCDIIICGHEGSARLHKLMQYREGMVSDLISARGASGLISALIAVKKSRRNAKFCVVLKYMSILAGLAAAAVFAFGNADGYSMTGVQILAYNSIWAILSFLAVLIDI